MSCVRRLVSRRLLHRDIYTLLSKIRIYLPISFVDPRPELTEEPVELHNRFLWFRERRCRRRSFLTSRGLRSLPVCRRPFPWSWRHAEQGTWVCCGPASSLSSSSAVYFEICLLLSPSCCGFQFKTTVSTLPRVLKLTSGIFFIISRSAIALYWCLMIKITGYKGSSDHLHVPKIEIRKTYNHN